MNSLDRPELTQVDEYYSPIYLATVEEVAMRTIAKLNPNCLNNTVPLKEITEGYIKEAIHRNLLWRIQYVN